VQSTLLVALSGVVCVVALQALGRTALKKFSIVSGDPRDPSRSRQTRLLSGHRVDRDEAAASAFGAICAVGLSQARKSG